MADTDIAYQADKVAQLFQQQQQQPGPEPPTWPLRRVRQHAGYDPFLPELVRRSQRRKVQKRRAARCQHNPAP
eukprot:3089504-Rhodomonas_salina.3